MSEVKTIHQRWNGLMDSIRDFRGNVVELAERHPKITATTGMIAFGLLYLYGLPNFAQLCADPALVDLDKAISSTGLGRETLEGFQFILYSLSSQVPVGKAPSIIGNVGEFVAEGLTIGGFAASLLKLGTSSVSDWWYDSLMAKERKQRIINGEEPVPIDNIPRQVLIGHSGIIGDLSKLDKEKKDVKRPVIGIHPDSGKVATLGSKVQYHFRLDYSELIDLDPPTAEETAKIEIVGLDRADEITFACMNPDNALFYGKNAKAAIRPTTISTVLNKILEHDPNRLRGKKVNVITNESEELGGVMGIRADLTNMAARCGFELNIVLPEEQVMHMVNEQVRKISMGKGTGAPINIALVGQGSTIEDAAMIAQFQKAISTMDVEGVTKDRIKVTVIQKESIDDFRINGRTITKEDQQKLLREKLTESDFILTYGDTDDGTSSLVNLMTNVLGIDKVKVHALIERPSNVFDVLNDRYLDKDNVHCVYDMVMRTFNQAQTQNYSAVDAS